MGSKYLWRLSNGAIQGQAGKPFAHQAGPVIKYPCLQEPVDNACLCNYRATRYYAYYEYLSPQLQDVQVIVKDSNGNSSVSTVKGHKWKLYNTPFYLGCYEHINAYGDYDTPLPFYWSDGEPVFSVTPALPDWLQNKTCNSSQTQLSAGKITRKLDFSLRYEYAGGGSSAAWTPGDRTLRYHIVNTYQPCGGSFYEGQIIRDQSQDPYIPDTTSPSYISTGKYLCVVDYTVNKQRYASQGGVYSNYVSITGMCCNAKSVLPYSELSILPSDAYGWSSIAKIRSYTQIPDSCISSNTVTQFCNSFANNNIQAARTKASSMWTQESFTRPWINTIWEAATVPYYKLYNSTYSNQSVTWSLVRVSFCYTPQYQLQGFCYSQRSAYYTPFSVFVGSTWPEGSYHSSYVQCVSKWDSNPGLVDYFSASTIQQLASVLNFTKPTKTTIKELNHPSSFFVVGRHAAYSDMTPGTTPPCNAPDTQPYVMDSNYKFVRYNIWQLAGFSAVHDSNTGKVMSMVAADNNLTLSLKDRSLYQYQLLQRGWLEGRTLKTIKKGQSGKFFYPIQDTRTINTVNDFYSIYRDQAKYISTGSFLRPLAGFYSTGGSFVVPFYYIQGDFCTSSQLRQIYSELSQQPIKYPKYTAALYNFTSYPCLVMKLGEIVNKKAQNNSSLFMNFGAYSLVKENGQVFMKRYNDYLPAESDRELLLSSGLHDYIPDLAPQVSDWQPLVQLNYSSTSVYKTFSVAQYAFAPDAVCQKPDLAYPEKARFWYKARRFVPVCTGGSIIYSCNNTPQLDSSVYSYQYPATQAFAQAAYYVHSDDYVVSDGSRLAMPASKNLYFHTGPYFQDSLVDGSTTPVDSFYKFYQRGTTWQITDLEDSSFKDAVSPWLTSATTDNPVQYLQSQTYYGRQGPVSYLYDRTQELISAVSGTSCASCVSFSTLLFEPQAQLPQERLGYTYIKYPETVSIVSSVVSTWVSRVQGVDTWHTSNILYTFYGTAASVYSYTNVISVRYQGTQTWEYWSDHTWKGRGSSQAYVNLAQAHRLIKQGDTCAFSFAYNNLAVNNISSVVPASYYSYVLPVYTKEESRVFPSSTASASLWVSTSLTIVNKNA